ncbi:molybdopterin-dependent oxidoreductase [Hippea maritima]|uniref:NADH dehydrogenase (Quinone) n=1 Tax=Hippea maritima (strain ATCC 700847 / DSM 10411 / MH2) TaxID=760142 RepID=F2LXM7_HIPMA|nr:molybdopterin-dependent oxidoreductase [Hippea maritima]AEA33213.1 NADH dehydrogenase (quinone) [Hippea maritima DSM 10411]
MADTVKIKINGKEYEASKDESILQVARRNGIYIPAICYSDRFGAIGACRVCAVEIVGMKKPMLSCAVKVKDGMEILTDSEKAREFREGIVQEWDKFHPLQCGVCDKSGECDLQDVNYYLNITSNPKEEEADPLSVPNKSIHHEWRIIHHDANLCIACRRCVTICDKVVNFGILAMAKKEWGGREVDTKDGKPLECEFCGQCVSICPTGAMSSKLFKYKARPWEMEKVRTTCQFCASGCQMDLNVKDNKVLRVTSEDNTPNLANLCNLGRFNYSVIEPKNLVLDAYINGRKTSYDSAIAEAVKVLKSVKGDEIAAICGSRGTVEDEYATKIFMNNAIKSNNLDAVASTHIAKLYKYLPKGVAPFNNVRDMEECDVIFAFGGDVANEMPRLDWQITRNVKLLKKSKLVSAYWRDTKIDTLGSIALRYEVGDELKFLASLFDALSAALNVKSDALAGGNYEIAEDAVKALTEASKIAFVVGQEALERPFGEEVAKALADLMLLFGDKVKLYVSSKYNNAYGSLFAGAVNGFDTYGRKVDGGFSVYNLKNLIKDGKLKVLLLMNADLYELLSDEDAAFVLENAKVVAVETYMSETVKHASVVLPSATFAGVDGHFVNIEGKLNKVRKALNEPNKPAWKVIADISNLYGYNLPLGYIKELVDKASFELEGDLSDFVKVNLESATFEGELKGAVVYSKFRSGIFSSFGEGAHIASSEAYLEMNPEDAQNLGLEDESVVKVEDLGALSLKVKVDEKMPKGVVSVPLWYEGSNVYSLSGSFNNLFSAKITKGE